MNYLSNKLCLVFMTFIAMLYMARSGMIEEPKQLFLNSEETHVLESPIHNKHKDELVSVVAAAYTL